MKSRLASTPAAKSWPHFASFSAWHVPLVPLNKPRRTKTIKLKSQAPAVEARYADDPRLRQTIIWDKQWPVLTRKDFMGAHEWAFYGWREGAAHEFFGPNNATDLWSIKKVTPQSMVHLTEKPAELAARAMEYSSRPGENVLDLFGGSGSTLIGAEQTGRKAFLVELDPLYCDVIVERWQQFSGQRAVHADTGALFPKEPSAVA